MSVVGIDLGNDTAVVAQAKRGGVDILLNENSQRLNRVLVSFNGKERFIGEAAVPQARSNYKNTVSQVKRLLGRKFSEPDVQYELSTFLPYSVVQLEGDAIGIRVMYNDEEKVLTPEQVLGMFFTKMRGLVESASGSRTADVVVSVPPFFTDAQRHAMLDACHIGGVKCLRLLNDTTAAALAYGMYKSAKGEFDPEKETKVMFVCMGHASFSVSIVGYIQGKLRVIACASEPNAGGRDIDLGLARHLTEEFKAKTGCDAWANVKARIKVLAAAEKAKQTLSPHGVTQAPVNLECLMEDRDFSTRVTLETLNQVAEPMLNRLEEPLRRAMAQADVTLADLSAVEMLGGGMRPRCVKHRVASVLDLPAKDDPVNNFGLSSTMNMDECISRGAAFACAMLSPLFRVKEVAVQDAVPFPIRVSWDIQSEGKEESEPSVQLYKVGDATPSTKRITFKTADPFTVAAEYDSSAAAVGHLPESTPRGLLSFRVDGIPDDVKAAAAADPTALPRIRVDFTHDINGMFSVEKAVLMKELPDTTEEDAATPAADTPKSSDGDKAKDGKDGKDGKDKAEGGHDAAAASEDGKGAKPADGAEAGAGAKDAEDGKKPESAGASAEPPAKKKKKQYQRVTLSVNTTLRMGMSETQMKAAMELEAAMQQQDRVIRETQDKRNELEAYIYGTRDALLDRLAPFASEADKSALTAALTETEDWLYGDGFDTTKAVYQAKLDALRVLGDPITNRQYETEHRQAAVAAFNSMVEKYRRIASSTDPLYEHLTDEDRDTLRGACKGAEAWLADKMAAQASVPLTSDPVVRVADIQQEEQKLRNACHPTATKPKPPPPKPAPAPAPDAAAGEGAGGGEGEAAPDAAAAGAAGGEGGASADAPATDAPATDAPATDADGDVVVDDDATPAPVADGGDAAPTADKGMGLD